MRGRVCGVLAVIAALSLASPVLSQTSGVQTSGNQAAPQKPQPEHYTAELRETSVNTLANGTTITRESISVIAKDSHGRSMMSDTVVGNLKDGKPVISYSVSDPVAGTFTTWNSPGTKAFVTTRRFEPTAHSDCTVFFSTPEGYSLNAPQESETTEAAKKVVGRVTSMMWTSSAANPLAGGFKPPQINSTTEDLGTTIIKGVEAHGKQFTWTTPAGAYGNDRPMVHTHETWITTGDNPRYLNVRNIDDDPRSGRSTMELERLSLEEPDLAVFQVPEGYEIVTSEVHSAPCPKEMKQPAQ